MAQVLERPSVPAPPPPQAPDGGNGGEGGSYEGFALPTAKLALWLLLVVATMLFSVLMAAYLVRMGYPDWQSLPKPGLLWVNTVLLGLASAALQWALTSARVEWSGEAFNGARARLGLVVGGVFGALFIAGQIVAWQQLQSAGHFVATNPSSSFFYLITAIHGLHLLGGLALWGRVVARLQQGRRPLLGLELCALYWHFLLLVWLILYALMLVT
jgi:cytochrome c oxidase subunit 3